METNLRKTFADICLGYSAAQWGDRNIFIKHLSHLEHVDLDFEYDKHYQNAKNRGIKTREEKAKWLNERGLWTKKMDADLSDQKVYLDNLKKTLKKMVLKSQIDNQKSEIEKAEIKYFTMSNEKEFLLDLTCEKYAEQKMSNYYIYTSLYEDCEMKKKLFSKKDFDALDDDEMDSLFFIYTESAKNFSEKNLKKIAVSDFFTFYFNICEKQSDLFGKPIFSLSYNQLNLLYYAKYFKTIMEGHEFSHDIRQDPEKIEEFVNASLAAQKLLKKSNANGRVGIVGATKEDMDYIGGQQYDPRMKKAIKAGGISSVEEAAKLSLN